MAVMTCSACGELAGSFHRCSAGETGHYMNRPDDVDTDKIIQSVKARFDMFTNKFKGEALPGQEEFTHSINALLVEIISIRVAMAQEKLK